MRSAAGRGHPAPRARAGWAERKPRGVGRAMAARDTAGMPLSLMMAAGFVVGVVASHAVTVPRYSPSHVVGEVSLAGRGLFFSRTPGGVWGRGGGPGRGCTPTNSAAWG